MINYKYCPNIHLYTHFPILIGEKYRNNNKKNKTLNLYICSIKIASHLYHQRISGKLKITCVHYTGIPGDELHHQFKSGCILNYLGN